MSWLPVAILAALLTAVLVAYACDIRRNRRRVDPLTYDQVQHSKAVQAEREAGR